MNTKAHDTANLPRWGRQLLAWLLLSACMTQVAAAAGDADRHTGTVLVFGDSLSAAYRMNETEGWVHLLQQRLVSEGIDYQVINGSVSGETTVGGLARLPAMLEAHTPDVVVLELGGNDGLRGLPVPAIKQNLEQMIRLSQDSGARVLLVGMQIPPNYGARYTAPFYAQYQELAQAYGVPLIPFLLDGIADNAELMQSDGVHPTAAAQPRVLEIVWPALQELL